MKTYATQFIRNVGIAGHGDTGKTQLVSSLLFTAGMTTRLGKVAEGNTVTDWDEEEIARKITIHTGQAFRSENPAGVVVTVHRGDDHPAGKGRRRQHRHRLGRRGNRAQDHDSYWSGVQI